MKRFSSSVCLGFEGKASWEAACEDPLVDCSVHRVHLFRNTQLQSQQRCLRETTVHSLARKINLRQSFIERGRVGFCTWNVSSSIWYLDNLALCSSFTDTDTAHGKVILTEVTSICKFCYFKINLHAWRMIKSVCSNTSELIHEVAKEGSKWWVLEESSS